MIKCVIFDLGGVIVPFDFQRGYQKMAPHCSYPASEIRGRIGATDLVQRFETGRIGPEEFVEELCAALELKVNYQEFCEIWSAIFLDHTLVPESLLTGLKENYRLLLLSNTNPIHFTMLRHAYPLLAHFDRFILSYEVGALKPAPEIYQEALSHSGCAPGECFFTDDIPAYVEGALKAGIDAVQFESAGQIERELRARGVSWRN
jgi:putative hydrolase of the HAD superfamily